MAGLWAWTSCPYDAAVKKIEPTKYVTPSGQPPTAFHVRRHRPDDEARRPDNEQTRDRRVEPHRSDAHLAPLPSGVAGPPGTIEPPLRHDSTHPRRVKNPGRG
jgi:hypothetical protein